jgi:hypothetical protein
VRKATDKIGLSRASRALSLPSRRRSAITVDLIPGGKRGIKDGTSEAGSFRAVDDFGLKRLEPVAQGYDQRSESTLPPIDNRLPSVFQSEVPDDSEASSLFDDPITPPNPSIEPSRRIYTSNFSCPEEEGYLMAETENEEHSMQVPVVMTSPISQHERSYSTWREPLSRSNSSGPLSPASARLPRSPTSPRDALASERRS